MSCKLLNKVDTITLHLPKYTIVDDMDDLAGKVG